MYRGSVSYIYCNFDRAEEHCSLYSGLTYIEVLFHTFYCNFVRAEEYRSLYRGFHHFIRGFRCIKVLFHTFIVTLTGLKNIVRYTEDFVIPRFYSIRFTVSLSGLKNIVRYTEDFVISRFYFIHFIVILSGLKIGISFVIPTTSLYRGSLNRVSAV